MPENWTEVIDQARHESRREVERLVAGLHPQQEQGWAFAHVSPGRVRLHDLLNLFFAVILIELGGLYWGLRQTAAQGRRYGQQVLAGTGMALIAGVIIIGSSLLFTMVAFPDYFAELEAIHRQQMAAEDMAPAEIDAALEARAIMFTPLGNALTGFAGTLITGILGSAIIAAFVKAPAKAAASPARV